MRPYVRLGVTIAIAALVVSGCRTPSPPSRSDAPPPPVASPAASSAQEIDTVVGEMTVALEAARGLRDALRLASGDPNWDRVARACRSYPLGPVDAAFGVRLTQGLRSQSGLQGWWVEQVTAIDVAAATTCFVTSSAGAIPPGSRVEAGGPTTAEIAMQPLQAALDELADSSPQGLRSLVEKRTRSGT